MEVGARVLVADGDEDARAQLARLLSSAGYGVTETGRGDDAFALARSTSPAAVILEVPLPGLCGYEVCHLLKSQPGPQLPVIFLSSTRTEAYDRIAGLLLKADDYIIKPYAAGELLARLSNLIARFEMTKSTTGLRLTKREEEVLELMSDGLRHGEIAQRLFISPKTVATHVEHILRKLRVRSSTEAVALAYREEIFRPKARLGSAAAEAPSHDHSPPRRRVAR
jgi:DNA-binding NarL/FixJ family response regulator